MNSRRYGPPDVIGFFASDGRRARGRAGGTTSGLARRHAARRGAFRELGGPVATEAPDPSAERIAGVVSAHGAVGRKPDA